MDKEEVLTIDAAATKENILRDGRSVAPYARARDLNQSSLAQILNGEFPPNKDPKGVYQRALRVLQKDGYLVQAGQAPIHSAAA